MSSPEESVYRINSNGTVRAVHITPGEPLGELYARALQCEFFEYVQEHRIVSNGVQTDYTLWLVGDEEAATYGDAEFNLTVSQVLGREFFGSALLVCMHAVGDDGEERLADVGLIYRAISSALPTPWTEQHIAEIRSRPLRGRALELLGLFDLV
jgi:hypothetical protein